MMWWSFVAVGLSHTSISQFHHAFCTNTPPNLRICVWWNNLACQNENWMHGKINVGFWYIKYTWQILKHFAVEHFIKHKLWNCKEVYTQLSIIWNTRTTKNGAGPKVPFHTLIWVCKNECAKKILCTSFGTGIHFILFNGLTKNVFIIFSLLFLKTTTIVSSINNGKDRSFKMLP